MKTILIFHSNQQSILELQTQLAGKCYVYATTNGELALEFIKQNPVDALIIYFSSQILNSLKQESLTLLAKLRKTASPDLLRIVVCSDREQNPVKEFIGLGVTAIVGSEKGVKVVLGV